MDTPITSKPKFPQTYKALTNRCAGTIVVESFFSTSEGFVPNPEEPRWVPHLRAYLKDRFPGHRLSMGNTRHVSGASRLNMWQFRTEEQLHLTPQLTASLENRVRYTLSLRRTPEILFVFSPVESDIKSLVNGAFPESYIMLQQIAAYYRIPFINLGLGLWKAHMIENIEWSDLVENHVRPSELGIDVCAQQLIEYLSENLRSGHTPKKDTLPAALCAETSKKIVS